MTRVVCLLSLVLAGCAYSVGPAATSTLSRGEARDMARAAAATARAEVLSVAATGSMRPVLDANAQLVVERCDFAAIQQGDIVLYSDASGRLVVHRVIRWSMGEWVLAGDANGRIDSVELTRENFRGRVCAIIYGRRGE